MRLGALVRLTGVSDEVADLVRDSRRPCLGRGCLVGPSERVRGRGHCEPCAGHVLVGAAVEGDECAWWVCLAWRVRVGGGVDRVGLEHVRLQRGDALFEGGDLGGGGCGVVGRGVLCCRVWAGVLGGAVRVVRGDGAGRVVTAFGDLSARVVFPGHCGGSLSCDRDGERVRTESSAERRGPRCGKCRGDACCV